MMAFHYFKAKIYPIRVTIQNIYLALQEHLIMEQQFALRDATKFKTTQQQRGREYIFDNMFEIESSKAFWRDIPLKQKTNTTDTLVIFLYCSSDKAFIISR